MADEKTISRRVSVQVAFNGVDITITAKVKNVGEAKKLAEKYLRLANKYAKTAEFELPGNPALPAGVTVELAGFGRLGRKVSGQDREA